MALKADLMSSPSSPSNLADDLLTIGELASRTGKTASSIRYYESIGLLPLPQRIAGRRRYSPEIVRTLTVVDTAQRAGMSLDEIRLLLEATPEDDPAIDRLRELAERKLPEIQATIERTEAVKRWLEAAAACRCPSLDDCPLFDDDAGLALPSRVTSVPSAGSA